jgi:hypothetical protein
MTGTTKDSIPPHLRDSQRPARQVSLLSVDAVVASLILAILSFFWEWGSSTFHEPLKSNPEIWLVVMPVCVVLAASSIMVWFRAMSSTVFNLCVLVAAGWIAYLLADVVNTLEHHATLGLGAKLALGSLAAACLAAASLRPPSIVVTPSGLIWGTCFLLCALAWVVGVWGPWVQTVAHIGVSGPTWRTTHTADFVQNCCYAFSGASTLPDKLESGLTMAIIVIGSIVFALCLPGWVSGSSVIALGVLYAGESLSWIYHIAHVHPNPVTLGGVTEALVANDHITATVTGEIYGWIAVAAVIALIVLGVFRLLSSFIQTSSAPDRPREFEEQPA